MGFHFQPVAVHTNGALDFFLVVQLEAAGYQMNDFPVVRQRNGLGDIQCLFDIFMKDAVVISAESHCATAVGRIDMFARHANDRP